MSLSKSSYVIATNIWSLTEKYFRRFERYSITKAPTLSSLAEYRINIESKECSNWNFCSAKVQLAFDIILWTSNTCYHFITGPISSKNWIYGFINLDPWGWLSFCPNQFLFTYIKEFGKNSKWLYKSRKYWHICTRITRAAKTPNVLTN